MCIAVPSRSFYKSVDDQPQHCEEPVELKCSRKNSAREIPTAGRRNVYNDLSLSATNPKVLASETPYEELDGVSNFSLLVLSTLPNYNIKLHLHFGLIPRPSSRL